MSMPTPLPAGSLACVGVGMVLGAHLSPRALAYIEQSDVVFAVVSDPVVELWLQSLRPDLRSLQPLYAPGKPRHATYSEMVDALLGEVRKGARVCAAFYGHPGVFAKVPHDAVAAARAQGFGARIEPGISAEACLYADLGIDPGRVGCQHHEASQLLFYQRVLDPTAYLVLWQIGVVGDRTYRRFSTSAPHRALLVERLLRDYPAAHEVIVYEAATLPMGEPRMERVRLDALCDASLHMHSTLVVPPVTPPRPDTAMRQRLAQLERSLEAQGASA